MGMPGIHRSVGAVGICAVEGCGGKEVAILMEMPAGTSAAVLASFRAHVRCNLTIT